MTWRFIWSGYDQPSSSCPCTDILFIKLQKRCCIKLNLQPSIGSVTSWAPLVPRWARAWGLSPPHETPQRSCTRCAHSRATWRTASSRALTTLTRSRCCWARTGSAGGVKMRRSRSSGMRCSSRVHRNKHCCFCWTPSAPQGMKSLSIYLSIYLYIYTLMTCCVSFTHRESACLERCASVLEKFLSAGHLQVLLWSRCEVGGACSDSPQLRETVIGHLAALPSITCNHLHANTPDAFLPQQYYPLLAASILDTLEKTCHALRGIITATEYFHALLQPHYILMHIYNPCSL